METNIRKMVAKARPKVDAILQARLFYSTWDLMRQYKTHVLCLLEGNSAAFYHASIQYSSLSTNFKFIFSANWE